MPNLVSIEVTPVGFKFSRCGDFCALFYRVQPDQDACYAVLSELGTKELLLAVSVLNDGYHDLIFLHSEELAASGDSAAKLFLFDINDIESSGDFLMNRFEVEKQCQRDDAPYFPVKTFELEGDDVGVALIDSRRGMLVPIFYRGDYADNDHLVIVVNEDQRMEIVEVGDEQDRPIWAIPRSKLDDWMVEYLHVCMRNIAGYGGAA